MTQEEIARQLGVGQATVSRDIDAVKQQYRADRTAILEREHAELDQMERDASVEFARTKDREWLSERRELKRRRSAMLGLDAPRRVSMGFENMPDPELNAYLAGLIEARVAEDAPDAGSEEPPEEEEV